MRLGRHREIIQFTLYSSHPPTLEEVSIVRTCCDGGKTVARSAVIDSLAKTPPHEWEVTKSLAGDPRWETTQRIILSRHFERSALLKRFLLYIVAGVIRDRKSEITEHQIGVRVFDRPQSYRTVEDNIVRNYARQLRRRLSEYYADEGASDVLRLDIPLGAYVPVFVQAATVAFEEPVQETLVPNPPASGESSPSRLTTSLLRRRWKHLLIAVGLLVAYSGLLVGLSWFAAIRFHDRQPSLSAPTNALWAAIFGGSSITYIVPADAGLNLLEDVSHHLMPLADYINSGYFSLPLSQLDGHSSEDMRTQQLTSYVDLQIVTSLERLPYFDPRRATLRFPRELRLDDLKNVNAVILGSVGSNPWAAIADQTANFRITNQPGMNSAVILNNAPLPGEAVSYPSHWNEPTHDTYAVIQYLPNLAGTGHLLLLQGLDVAGTQACAEVLLHPVAIAAILQRATRPDGTLRPFEILLHATSLGSSATDTHVVADRIH